MVPVALSSGPAVLPDLFHSQGGPPASLWGGLLQAKLEGITVQRISPGEGGQVSWAMASWRRICGRCCSRGGVVGVGHPVKAAAGPEPSIPADPFALAVGEQSLAGSSTDRADQIQMPACGELHGPALALLLACPLGHISVWRSWLRPLQAPGIHRAATPKGGRGDPPYGGGGRSAGSPPPGAGRFQSGWAGSIRSATGLRGFRMKDWASKLGRSRDIDPALPEVADTLLSNAMDILLFYRTTLNLRFSLRRALQPSPAVLAALLHQRSGVHL